jgi:hypothetical protein
MNQSFAGRTSGKLVARLGRHRATSDFVPHQGGAIVLVESFGTTSSSSDLYVGIDR